MGGQAGRTEVFDRDEQRNSRSFWLALVLGIIVGPVLGAGIGFGLGALFLSWFAGPYCCGLEGLLAPVLGVMIGAGLGLVVPVVLAMDVRNARPLPRPLVLVVAWPLCVLFAWVVGTALSVDYEDFAPVVGFHLVTLIAPFGTWLLWGRFDRPATPTASH